METTYFKLIAKKRMMKNYFKCFIVSVFPFTSFLLLVISNYFLFKLLKYVSHNEYFLPYAEYIPLLGLGVGIVFSIFIWESIKLFVDSYFLLKSLNKKTTFIKTIKCVSFRQCATSFMVSVIRFFLCISWFAVYLLPCIVVSLLLIYSYKNENNGFNINLTLLVSAILLFVIGVSFLYITLKRYSMCSFVVLTDEETSPLKVIVKSINLMEKSSLSYASFCLSYFGWRLSCFFVVPIFYVLPYIALGKWCFKNSLEVHEFTEPEKNKPIIFYFTKRVPN